MATSSAEIPEVMVGGRHVSIEELDNLRDAVCLLKWQSKDKSKQWSGYGFYANIKTKKQGTTLDINCIITIYDDIFLEMEEHGSDMVAVFHRESDKKEAFDLPLVPFNLLAHGGTLPLDYALIFIDESKMKAKGVKPILADGSELPDVQPNDEVHMIHHPGTLKKHYSEDKARNVTRHCIRYHAKTLEGPPGSPVFVFRDSKFLLVAMHCNNKRKGVLVSYILDDLHIPSVLSKLPEPRQNPFVRALSWALSWLSPSFLLAPFMRPTHGHVFHSGGSVLSWPSFSPPRGIRYGSSSYGEVVPSTRTRPILSGSAAPQYETSGDSSSDDFSLDDEDSDFDGFSLDNEVKLQELPVAQCGPRTRIEQQSADPRTRITRMEEEGTEPVRIQSFLGPFAMSNEDFPFGSSLYEEASTFAYPGQVKKVITTNGGVLNIGNFTLEIGRGCLAEDTLITLIKHRQDSAIKTLLDLSLVDAVPEVVKFLPDGLVFLKPADVAIRLEKKFVPESEHFILHGSYDRAYKKTVWELVTNCIEENNEKGVINMKINHFSLFTYVQAKRGKLARILGHLNGYFTCCAYSFYRRIRATDTIDISVVFLSEFVDEKKREDIKQLRDHFETGYIIGDKGFLKPVHTNHDLEVSLDFPEIENPPFLFKVPQAQLDSVGFAVDHFKRIAVKSPAIGAVKISEIKSRAKKESLWELNVCEIEDEIRPVKIVPEAQLPQLDVPPKGIHQFTKLTNSEIIAMSRKVGIDWEDLAALIDIPCSEQEEIRVNYAKYPSLSSKAKRVLEFFNESKSFDRHILIKHFEYLRRQDLTNEMPPLDDEGEEVCSGATATSTPEISQVQPEITEEQLQNDPPLSNKQSESQEVGTAATATSPPEMFEVQPEISEGQLSNNTPLSPREMHKLSRNLVVTWDQLAAHLGITSAEREDIRYSLLYTKSHFKAEKVLAIFNNMKDFSRQKLADCLGEIGELELKEPVITGEWRK